MANVDPRLISKLNSALAEEKVKAVFTITQQPITGNSQAPSKTNPAEEIINRAEIATNEKPANFKYYRNLSVLMVEASNFFIQKLIEDPEISTAALAEENDVYKL